MRVIERNSKVSDSKKRQSKIQKDIQTDRDR